MTLEISLGLNDTNTTWKSLVQVMDAKICCHRVYVSCSDSCHVIAMSLQRIRWLVKDNGFKVVVVMDKCDAF